MAMQLTKPPLNQTFLRDLNANLNTNKSFI